MRAELVTIVTGIQGATCTAAPVPWGTRITFSERGCYVAEKAACGCAVFSDFKNGTFQSKEMLAARVIAEQVMRAAHHSRQKDFPA